MTDSPDPGDSVVEAVLSRWRESVAADDGLSAEQTAATEEHLLTHLVPLIGTGLSPDEALLVALSRVTGSDQAWRQVWQQAPGAGPRVRPRGGATALMLVWAGAAAIGVHLPRLLGHHLGDEFYGLHLGLFALVPLAGYFLTRHRARPRVLGTVAALFALPAAAGNAYDFVSGGQALVLTALHLPLLYWLVVGVAYADGAWHSHAHRLQFMRFSGEWAIHYVLIALGGGVLVALSLGTFAAIGVDAEDFASEWLIPSGACAAVVVTAWQVQTHRSLGAVAPMLARVFTPLFLVALLALLAGALLTGNRVDIQRDVLIRFDLLLVVVVGLLIYGTAIRSRDASWGWFDTAQLALASAALVVDLWVLIAIGARITEFGFSANKSAALGENLILLVNLAGAAWLLTRTALGSGLPAAGARWQTGFLPVYAGWAAAVALGFPLLFGTA